MTQSLSASLPRMVFLRGLVWSLIGLIYAPLFTGFHVLFRAGGLEHGAFIPAAALAGAVGAAFYGARQVALAGTLIGLTVAALTFALVPGPIAPWKLALGAAATGTVLGALVRFPDRCSLHVPGKVLAGSITGAACGLLLSLVEPLHPENFTIMGAVAFMVSVNGVLYVATVPWWAQRAALAGRGLCNLIEAAVIAVLAAAAAVSLWVVVGPLIGVVHPQYYAPLEATLALMPLAMTGGLLAGAVTGALLEAFGFRWVHDV